MAMTENELNNFIGSEEVDALDYSDEISSKRETLLDYYNQRPYGDEVDGKSKVVTSDVADTVEWMIPALMKVFTQGSKLGIFLADTEEGEEEAHDKTAYSNWVFNRDNPGALILHTAIKDALLQFTGVMKVYYDESEQSEVERYKGLSELELQRLQFDDEITIDEIEQGVNGFDVEATRSNTMGRIKIVNIPPEEFKIDRNARDFIDPRFIGHRTPKTRSDLIAMGFDRDLVDSLPADQSYYSDSQEKLARYYDYAQTSTNNPTNHHPNDIIYLGEYYTHIDMDDDGVTELWQIFRAGEKILGKERVDVHPFAVLVSVPMPHRAIGSCPAEQVADLQLVNSVLLRQALDNVYAVNHNMVAINDRVEMDDLLTRRAGDVVRVEGEAPIGDALQEIVVQPIGQQILAMIEYVNSMREARSGVTRYNQGLDTESLNKTATGFKGIMDSSQQRIELVARLMAEGGLKELFRKIIMWASKYQNDSRQIRVLGKTMEIDPTGWRHNTDCSIHVGLGQGDRQEKIMNLNVILQQQKEFMQLGSPLADQSKAYNTLDKLITEVGLKDVGVYFNDPDKPEELLQAENEQLKAMLQQAQQMLQQANPLAEQERIKQETQIAKIQADNQQFMAELMQKQEQFNRDMLFKLTELEAETNKDIPGSAI